MIEHVNYENKIITAGQFIPVSTRRVSAKEMARSIVTALGENNNEDTINYIHSVLNDNVVMPAERESLISRWNTIRDGYYRLKSTIEDAYGEEELANLAPLDNLVSIVGFQMNRIMAAGEEPVTVPATFEVNLSELITMYSNISLSYSKDFYEVSKYDIRINNNKSTYTDEETVEITCILYKDHFEVRNVNYSDYNIDWRVTGVQQQEVPFDPNNFKFCTPNPDGTFTQGIRFPAYSFTGTISIDCSMSIPKNSSIVV